MTGWARHRDTLTHRECTRCHRLISWHHWNPNRPGVHIGQCNWTITTERTSK